MYSKLQERLGTAGLIVAVVALVAALGGTAIAASGLNGKQKKEVRKIAKHEAKKNGKRGKQGKQGPQGAQGPQGPQGNPGAKGDTGAAGAAGKSVVTGTEPTETGNCEGRGGSWVEVEGSGARKYSCNGSEGSPWAAGGVLPANATETGGWTFGSTPAGGTYRMAVSFPVALAAGLDGSHVHYINKVGKEVVFNFGTEELEEVTPTECLGSAAEPTATAGNLCVYEGKLFHAFLVSNFSIQTLGGSEEPGASTAGVLLNAEAEEAGAFGYGTWAVTGE